MMKRVLIAAAAATLGLSGGSIFTGAMAADLRGPLQDTPPSYGVLPSSGAYNWSGAYIGANIGFGGGVDHYNTSISGANSTQVYNPYDGQYYPQSNAFNGNASDGQRSNGVIGGVQVGYNYEFGGCGCLGGLGGYGGYLRNVVVGVEADFEGTGIGSGGALSSFASGFPFGYAQNVNVNSQLNYLGTVRGRLGYAFDRILVYGTGGFAYGDVTASVSAPANNIATTSSQFHTGYVFGGGIEVAVTNNVLLRAEYLRAELNEKTVSQGAIPWTGFNYNVTQRPDVNIVRAGLDYKFGALAPAVPPVIARY